MRIVSGRYGSRRIETPAGRETRPTLEKVREAVFSSLGGRFNGGIFVDLYAGSGANGFEALSRGMTQAWFSDISREAVRVIRTNAVSLDCMDECRILNVSDRKSLNLFAQSGQKASVIYLDPPYARQHNDEILDLIDAENLMAEGGRIVIESDQKDTFRNDHGNLHYQSERIYGITRITYYIYEEEQ